MSVQLCDVPGRADGAAARGVAGPPAATGQGYGDTVGLVRALAEHGVAPAVMAVEVISDELVARGVDVAAQVTADAAREVLAQAAGGSRPAGDGAARGPREPQERLDGRDDEHHGEQDERHAEPLRRRRRPRRSPRQQGRRRGRGAPRRPRPGRRRVPGASTSGRWPWSCAGFHVGEGQRCCRRRSRSTGRCRSARAERRAAAAACSACRKAMPTRQAAEVRMAPSSTVPDAEPAHQRRRDGLDGDVAERTGR